MKIFETVLTESPLPFIKYYKKDIEITGTTTNPGKINYLRNLLPGEVICKFDTLENVNAGISNAHSQYIVQGLLKYPPPRIIFLIRITEDLVQPKTSTFYTRALI